MDSLLAVSVPVLSEQITETEPRASTEWSFFTIAFRFDIRSTPRASVTVVTMGNPSGMAATASDTVLPNGELYDPALCAYRTYLQW